TPGVYKRGNRYVVVYRDADGKQRKEACRTYDDARKRKGELTAAVANGEYRPPSKETLAEYGRRIIAGYVGRGRGFRERTRRDYSRDLERYIVAFFGTTKLVTAVRREDVRAFVAWLVDDKAQAKRHEQENAQRSKAAE